jgi:uncharacterized membrane protein YhaH (DUF805 family)
MTFGDSIKTCFKKYADFNGRASKSEYWWFVLFFVLASVILNMIHPALGGLFSLAILVPSIAVAARRLHDIDKSGWMQLIGLIPVLGWIFMIYLLVQDSKEPNRFGAPADAPADAAPGQV